VRVALKPGRPRAEPMGMAEIACPICDADLLFAGDEKPGDIVVCSYCRAPFTVKGAASDEEDWDLEEDF